jgi:NhaP-type Na+/H+ or K+/H+ antiporter
LWQQKSLHRAPKSQARFAIFLDSITFVPFFAETLHRSGFLAVLIGGFHAPA